MGFIATECDHWWGIYCEHLNWHYEYNLERHGPFKTWRERKFGSLDPEKFDAIQHANRSTMVHDSYEVTWYCHRCRKFETEVNEL